ncbi:MAG TPA: hypothetical protein VI386_22845 [Candidatus Sulfotelmatobacter sp.]
MKSRLSFAVLVALLSVTLPCFAAKNHVDISLRGPWILYVDSSKSFADWPVLIAMAPAVDNGMYAHQPPTVSNGDAYVLGDPNQPYQPTDSQVYCLTFDGKCARKGESSLDSDDYPAPNPVPGYIPKGQKRWDWVTASRLYYAPTLILPVPDSYGADTAWPMRFAPEFDKSGGRSDGGRYKVKGTYSTGVVLRYTEGPAWFDLNRCPNGNPKLRIGDCAQASVSQHTHLANTGTLHIEMKAPDTNWSCDPHVRYVYPQMLNLIGTPDTSPGPNVTFAYIDPAHDIDKTGNAVYDEYPSGYTPQDPTKPDQNGHRESVASEFCLEHDSQGGYVDMRWDPPSDDEKTVSRAGHHNDGEQTTKCKGAKDNVDPWIGCVQVLVQDIPETLPLGLTAAEVDVLREIKVQGSDLSFPRISQLRRLDDNIAFLGQLKSELDTQKSRADQTLPILLQQLFELFPQILRAKDSYTKTHGDCGAPVIHLTDK